MYVYVCLLLMLYIYIIRRETNIILGIYFSSPKKSRKKKHWQIIRIINHQNTWIRLLGMGWVKQVIQSNSYLVYLCMSSIIIMYTCHFFGAHLEKLCQKFTTFYLIPTIYTKKTTSSHRKMMMPNPIKA